MAIREIEWLKQFEFVLVLVLVLVLEHRFTEHEHGFTEQVATSPKTNRRSH